ncbi:LysR family transcriptional regulator [Labrys neptuniae]
MNLSLRQIDIFNAVMVNKSVTAAAARLGSSQPTLSREIREMEQRIGFDLFQRFGKRLTPTEQAILLHEVVLRSFIGLDEINRAASAIRTRNAANFRIASIPAYAESIIPRAIRLLVKTRPPVHFSIHSHEEHSLRHEMTTQVFDLGLAENLFGSEEATTETIPVGDMVCVLPNNHALAMHEALSPTDFSGQPFIYFGQNDPYRHKLDHVFLAGGVARNYAAETTTAASVCAMVAAGVGVSVINPLTAASYTGRDVMFRRLTVSVPYSLSVWRPLRSKRAVQAEKFVVALRQASTEMSVELQRILEP